ncbi:MAG: ABC transporter ATP-binding protein [Bacteroidales bacterium]|jgi:ABC-2 type transport system ATP-binding protein|nr:ABC transporter ATP-binding protein [Bacteroidales bacterium]
MNEIMIQVENLQKEYGGTTVLNMPAMRIAKGEMFGLVGNNGAGKTTFFRCLLDLIRPSAGMVRSKGEPVQGSEQWKSYTGAYLDEGFLIDYLSVEEYFDFLGKMHRMSKGDITDFMNNMSAFFNDEIIGHNKYIRDFSKGNQKKIGIAAALMGNPEILILDEPFTNLDPSSQIRLRKMLAELNERLGITMLISSHDLMHVTEVCGRIVALQKGITVHDLQTNENTLRELEAFFAV